LQYVNHWTDAFWFRSHREFVNFNNKSTYLYTSILKIRFHDPIPIPQIFRCQSILSNGREESNNISSSLSSTSVFLDKSSDNSSSVVFNVESSSPVPEITNNTLTQQLSQNESLCKVTFLVKELSVGKFQWKCVTDDNVSQKISYRHNWYCTTAEQCRNYYTRAKEVSSFLFNANKNQSFNVMCLEQRKTCVKRLSKDEECNGCITYSGFTSLVLFCKTDTNEDHWTLPISYSLKSETTFPNQSIIVYYYLIN